MCFFLIFQAYADLVRTLGWKSFVILFQTEDSLVKLQELIKVPQNFEDVKMTLRQLDLTTDDYRPLLKEIKKSGETRIVLDCDFDKVQDILRQADEIGLINDYHAYIITNLDVERLDLSDLKFNNVNITGLRLVDTANPDVAEYVKSWTSTYGHGKGPAHPLFVSIFRRKNSNEMIFKNRENVFFFFLVCKCLNGGRSSSIRKCNERFRKCRKSSNGATELSPRSSLDRRRIISTLPQRCRISWLNRGHSTRHEWPKNLVQIRLD